MLTLFLSKSFRFIFLTGISIFYNFWIEDITKGLSLGPNIVGSDTLVPDYYLTLVISRF